MRIYFFDDLGVSFLYTVKFFSKGLPTGYTYRPKKTSRSFEDVTVRTNLWDLILIPQNISAQLSHHIEMNQTYSNQKCTK